MGSAQLITAERLAPDLQGPLDRKVRPDRARNNAASGEELQDGAVVDNPGVWPLVVHLPDLLHERPHLPPQGEEIGGAEEQGTGMRPLEHPNGRTKQVNEHLGEHELTNQEVEPMEEPEKAEAGARSPSPEYEDHMESEAQAPCAQGACDE